MRMRHATLADARAALWTLRSVHRARRQLRAHTDVSAVRLPAVPPLSPVAERAVRVVLRRSRATCLVSAVVRQAWYAAQGTERDVVIGVKPPAAGFAAHAWLDGDVDDHGEDFRELARFSRR